MRFLWFFTKDYWSYLLARKSNWVSWPTVLWCRFRNHPEGIVYYNPGGLEPDYHCRNCGDDLG